jgi:hypothetical protein
MDDLRMWQITDHDGIVHLRTSNGKVVCGANPAGWSDAVTELMRLNLVERCEQCGTRAPGLLFHVLTEVRRAQWARSGSEGR